jgi:hypothetical protein
MSRFFQTLLLGKFFGIKIISFSISNIFYKFLAFKNPDSAKSLDPPPDSINLDKKN